MYISLHVSAPLPQGGRLGFCRDRGIPRGEVAVASPQTEGLKTNKDVTKPEHSPVPIVFVTFKQKSSVKSVKIAIYKKVVLLYNIEAL